VFTILCFALAKEEKVEKTKAPTPSPSAEPTGHPTTSPSFSVAPTGIPSASPTPAPFAIKPTESPTHTPTASSTKKDPLKKQIQGAVVPMLTFDIILSDEDAILAATKDMDKFFKMFLDSVLESNSGMYQFDYSHLDSNVIVSLFPTRRRLTTGYSVKLDGIAYYFGDAPTRQTIARSLESYFSFWGER
jgi:hypothetical protein